MGNHDLKGEGSWENTPRRNTHNEPFVSATEFHSFPSMGGTNRYAPFHDRLGVEDLTAPRSVSAIDFVKEEGYLSTVSPGEDNRLSQR